MTEDADFDAELREEFGYPPEPDVFDYSFDELEEPINLNGHSFDFTHCFGINEMAEPYLGTKAYEKLPAALAAVPGVRAVVQEDREVYYVALNEGADAEQLDEALWQVFIKLAAEQA